MLIHGIEIPGAVRRNANNGDITAEGVSLKCIKETWRKFDTVKPAYKDDPKGYKSADRNRTTSLIHVVTTMLDGSVLEMVNGEVSKSDRKLDGIVRQVFPNEDD